MCIKKRANYVDREFSRRPGPCARQPVDAPWWASMFLPLRAMRKCPLVKITKNNNNRATPRPSKPPCLGAHAEDLKPPRRRGKTCTAAFVAASSARAKARRKPTELLPESEHSVCHRVLLRLVTERKPCTFQQRGSSRRVSYKVKSATRKR